MHFIVWRAINKIKHNYVQYQNTNMIQNKIKHIHVHYQNTNIGQNVNQNIYNFKITG